MEKTGLMTPSGFVLLSFRNIYLVPGARKQQLAIACHVPGTKWFLRSSQRDRRHGPPGRGAPAGAERCGGTRASVPSLSPALGAPTVSLPSAEACGVLWGRVATAQALDVPHRALLRPGVLGTFSGEKPTAARTAFFLARARWSRVRRRGCCAEEAGAARHPPAPATGRSLEGGGGPGALKPCPEASRPLPSVAGTKPPPGFPVGGNAHGPAFLPSPKFSRAGGRYQARASAAGVGKAKRRRVNTDDLLLLGN